MPRSSALPNRPGSSCFSSSFSPLPAPVFSAASSSLARAGAGERAVKAEERTRRTSQPRMATSVNVDQPARHREGSKARYHRAPGSEGRAPELARHEDAYDQGEEGGPFEKGRDDDHGRLDAARH